MAKEKKPCENCGKLVGTGLFSMGITVDGKHYCVECAEIIQLGTIAKTMNGIKEIGYNIPGPITNKKFIQYSRDFYNENQMKIKKLRSGKEGLYCLLDIDIKTLSKINKTAKEERGSMSSFPDIEKEIPLVLAFAGGAMAGRTWIIVTNENVYFRLDKKCGAINQHVQGNLSLQQIDNVEFKNKWPLCLKMNINGEFIGALTASEIGLCKMLQNYMSPLTLNNDLLDKSIESVKSEPIKSVESEPDVITKMKQLKELFDEGILTEEEFISKKKVLLEIF